MSTFMCGSNAIGEVLPLHIMFSSKAEEEKKSMNIEWCFGLPCIFAQFGHSSLQSFPALVTMNPNGGTDSRVLAQVLRSNVEQLYPDAKDKAGFRVLIKIDDVPGRLDLNSLTELRASGVYYLFPGVQNTTHVSQIKTMECSNPFSRIMFKF